MIPLRDIINTEIALEQAREVIDAGRREMYHTQQEFRDILTAIREGRPMSNKYSEILRTLEQKEDRQAKALEATRQHLELIKKLQTDEEKAEAARAAKSK